MRKRFTLVELLIVIAIIAILARMLLPSLTKARESARKAGCIGNMKQIVTAVGAYVVDYNGSITWSDDAGWSLRLIFGPAYEKILSSTLVPYLGGSAVPYTITVANMFDHDVLPVARCPSGRRDGSNVKPDHDSTGMNNSYAFNVYLTTTAAQQGKSDGRWHQYSRIKNPSTRFLMGDINYNCYDGTVDAARTTCWQQANFARRHNNAVNIAWADLHVSTLTHQETVLKGRGDNVPVTNNYFWSDVGASGP